MAASPLTDDKPKHTPGPWAVQADEGFDCSQAIFPFQVGSLSEECWTVAAIYGDVDSIPAEANARLIAAAPDLLTAAESFVAPYAFVSDAMLRKAVDGPDTDGLRLTRLSVLAARAAIRLALTGERA